MRIPDQQKREQRGCDGEIPAGMYPWDSSLTRCPRSLMTPEVNECLGWWDEWRRYGSLPFGTESFDTEPAHVLDVIDVCQRAFDEAQAEVTSA